MTDPILPEDVLEKLPCRELQSAINQRDRSLKIMLAVAAAALGFSTFIAAMAPIRQSDILNNQAHIILTLEQNRAALAAVDERLRALTVELEEHGIRR